MKSIEVDPWLDKWGRRVCENPAPWIKFGKVENFFLKDQLSEQEIVEPIFITGLARSGSTILLTMLHEHPDNASFSYQDFPFLHIHWFWTQFLRFSPRNQTAQERAHKDRILVTPESPEAMEEVLWMHFFPNLHSEMISHIKDRSFHCADFENYYLPTIKKVLFTHSAKRYLCKANYHITRIGYLSKLYPGARFIIPIRNPITHIQSLMKQHTLFSEAQNHDRRILNHFERVGHFEFGLGRAAINTGDPKDSMQINAYWKNEENIAGYALQWKLIYDYVYSLTQDPQLRDSILVVKYEDLCSGSTDQIQKIFDHLHLPNSETIIEKYKHELSLPTYYKHHFQKDEMETIRSFTEETAKKFGYLTMEQT